jgi:uncharacterized protein YyaL (SSP411 family)
LYDNALLIHVLSEAYKLGKQSHYREALMHTLEFCRREMKDASGGFYAALDADSEGEEGAYYVWTVEAVEEVLGKKRAAKWIEFWTILPEGNWEGKNILHETQHRQAFADKWGMDETNFLKELDEVKQALLAHRQQRIKPATDKKIILAWNGMLLTAFTKAYAALGEPIFIEEAAELFTFLREKFVQSGCIIGHQVYEGEVSGSAYLDDAAMFIEACLAFQEVTGDQSALLLAEQLTTHALKIYGTSEGPYFFYTNIHQKDVLFRKINCLDSPMPSANSTMCGNLLRLGVLFDQIDWKKQGRSMLDGMDKAMHRYPLSFSGWAHASICAQQNAEEWVITGPKSGTALRTLLNQYSPHRIIQTFFAEPTPAFPLLIGKEIPDTCNIYRCVNQTCQPPRGTIEEILNSR